MAPKSTSLLHHAMLTLALLLTQLTGVLAVTLQYTITEEDVAFRELGDVIKNASLPANLTTSGRLTLVNRTRDLSHYFQLSQSGLLRTSRRIDRDVICPGQARCVISLKVLATQPRTPTDYVQVVEIDVTILDINDNQPVYRPTRLIKNLTENTPAGLSFRLPRPEDPDSPRYGVQRYELAATDDATFELDASGSGSATAAMLKLKGTLDREAQGVHTLTVKALDGGSPPKEGLLTVVINVVDVNDHRPQFSQQLYQANISEAIKVNSSVIQIHARDLDEGENGRVTYGFSRETADAFGKIFFINARSGTIYTKTQLDYEKTHLYNLVVTAHDNSADKASSEVKVIIRLSDVNDNAPEVKVTALTNSGHVEISEAANSSTFVAHLSVSDADSGPGGEFRCSMDDPLFKLQQLYRTQYQVLTVARLDRETKPEHSLLFLCHDLGSPAMTSTAHIPVTVLDANDHAPHFVKEITEVEMVENNAQHENVVSVYATDKDAGANAAITYRILPPSTDKFYIDPKVGNISTLVSLDYERVQRYTVLVEAKDSGNPSRTSTSTVIIKVKDANDNKAEFDQALYQLEVYENDKHGVEVGRVHAADADSPPNDGFIYTLQADGDSRDAFDIDPRSGRIMTRKTLDRERQALYGLNAVTTNIEAPHNII